MPSSSRGNPPAPREARTPRRARTPRGRGPSRVRLSVIIAVVACGVAAGMWYTRVPRAETGAAPARVLIPVRASFREAAESLADAGLIRWPRAFTAYGSLTKRDRTIRAGTYKLDRGQDWSSLIEALRTGRGVIATVVIPEGWGSRRIITYVAKQLELPLESLQVAIRDTALRARVGAPAETLEGYLFPDTYQFALGTTARQVVAAMVSRFEHAWRPEWDARLAELHRSRNDIVTLASIVEKEVELPEERPVVAAVYWNRLKRGWKLQADPTVIYALGKSSAARVFTSETKIKSPYNTYDIAGLPPGPIASPGVAALEATLHPAQVPYLYFVGAPDGHHEFRKTYDEHRAAQLDLRARARADSLKRIDSTRRADSLKRGAPARGSDTGRGHSGQRP